MYPCTYVCTVFILIETRAFISYKWLLTGCLYEPLLHFTSPYISFRVLNPGAYLSPGIYMSPASIQINTVYVQLEIGWYWVSIHHVQSIMIPWYVHYCLESWTFYMIISQLKATRYIFVQAYVDLKLLPYCIRVFLNKNIIPKPLSITENLLLTNTQQYIDN